jgi:TPR repeat protein
MTFGEGVPKNRAKLLTLAQDTCAKGDLESCVMILDASDDRKLRMKSLALACDEANAIDRTSRAVVSPCSLLADHLIADVATAAEKKRGAELSRKLCGKERTPGDACSRLAWVYVRGTGVPRDDAAAMNLFRQRCDAIMGQGGFSDKNSMAAWLLGYCTEPAKRFRDGVGVEKDLAQALKLFEFVCTNAQRVSAAPACYELAVMLRDGVGTNADPTRARALFQRVCDEKALPESDEYKRACVEKDR